MANARRVVRRLNRDRRLSIGFLERSGLPIADTYAGLAHDGGLRLEPYDPLRHSDRSKFVTYKVRTTTSGSRVERWIYLSASLLAMTDGEQRRPTREERAAVRRQLVEAGLWSRDARSVVIDYHARYLMIRPI